MGNSCEPIGWIIAQLIIARKETKRVYLGSRKKKKYWANEEGK
jgi:hypothetical protein